MEDVAVRDDDADEVALEDPGENRRRDRPIGQQGQACRATRTESRRNPTLPSGAIPVPTR